MARMVRTYPARDDLRKIWLYIAKDSVARADRFIDEVERTLNLLARNPQLGQSVAQYRPGLRQYTVRKFILFYEPIDGGVRLVRVLHGARKIDELFE